MSELTDAIKFWQEHTDEIERQEELRDGYAQPLEQAAHKLLRDAHRYQRTGMYPRYRGVHTSTDPKFDGKLRFEISNGIDYGDDFGASFSLEELENSSRLFHPSDFEKTR